jgi:hypothetical protein
MLRYEQSDSFLYVIYAQIHRYTYCILDTVVTEPSNTIKTKDTCFEIAEAEVAPDDNWLDFKIFFPSKYLSNTRHAKFNLFFVIYAENTATVESKLHTQFFSTLKYACHVIFFNDFY